jgi:hypothetical protein
VFSHDGSAGLPTDVADGEKALDVDGSHALYFSRAKYIVLFRDPLEEDTLEFLRPIRVELTKQYLIVLQGRLVHVYPERETADPVGLLDVQLRRFTMPQDSCLRQAIENIDEWFHGYAPELN